jgi:hypothetical protein
MKEQFKNKLDDQIDVNDDRFQVEQPKGQGPFIGHELLQNSTHAQTETSQAKFRLSSRESIHITTKH